MSKKPETKFREDKVLPFLQTLPGTHVMAIQQMSFVGDPDFVLCVRGRFVSVELKSEEGAPRKLQKYIAQNIEKSGGIALFAYPQNWEQIQKLLLQLALAPKPEENKR